MKEEKTQEKNMDIKHFVTYYFSGIAKSEETFEVKSNELNSLAIPDNCYGFKAFDKASANIVKNGETIISDQDILNEKMYYIGKIMSMDDVKSEYAQSSKLTELIAKNCIGAVEAINGKLYPINENDFVNVVAPEDAGIIIDEEEAYRN